MFFIQENWQIYKPETIGIHCCSGSRPTTYIIFKYSETNLCHVLWLHVFGLLRIFNFSITNSYIQIVILNTTCKQAYNSICRMQSVLRNMHNQTFNEAVVSFQTLEEHLPFIIFFNHHLAKNKQKHQDLEFLQLLLLCFLSYGLEISLL